MAQPVGQDNLPGPQSCCGPSLPEAWSCCEIPPPPLLAPTDRPCAQIDTYHRRPWADSRMEGECPASWHGMEGLSRWRSWAVGGGWLAPAQHPMPGLASDSAHAHAPTFLAGGLSTRDPEADRAALEGLLKASKAAWKVRVFCACV